MNHSQPPPLPLIGPPLGFKAADQSKLDNHPITPFCMNNQKILYAREPRSQAEKSDTYTVL